MSVSVLTTIELDIEGDLKKAWGAVEGVVTKDAATLWNDAKVLLTRLAPAEYAILKGFIQTAVKDVITGDVADIETAVLNAAEAAGAAFISGLGSPLLQAFIAMVKAAL
jgi:hypothetical protein